MMRYRRYRAFLVFAVLSVIGIYYFTATDGGWQPSNLPSTPFQQLGSLVTNGGNRNSDPAAEVSTEDDGPVRPDLGGERTSEAAKDKADTPEAADKSDKLKNEPSSLHGQEKDHTKTVTTPNQGSKSGSDRETADDETKNASGGAAKGITKETSSEGKYPDVDSVRTGAGGDVQKPKVVVPSEVELGNSNGRGSDDEYSRPKPSETVHWSKPIEQFPVKSTIPLPTATPKRIPRIQHNFKPETELQKLERLKKLATIKKLAQFAWRGYQDEAWGHDETRPISGGYKDPFGGWAATLVDSLDTLWIMGMTTEFEEAVERTGKIDFTVCQRNDIPLFETTIRYLGGMLGAYDISGGKYKILLTKATELAEILMGAFDTPNRMPVTFYYWKPESTILPHRASTQVVMAELGSLSVEFTRLAQLTKEPKYYDAIDRITDKFVEWQNRPENGTWLPGLFPLEVDASGCDKSSPRMDAVNVPPPQRPIQPETTPPMSPPEGNARSDMGETGLSQRPAGVDTSRKSVEDDDSVGNPRDAASKPLHLGEPGRSRIAGWDDPIKEGSLDSESAKLDVLPGKSADASTANTQSSASDKAVLRKPVFGGVPNEKLSAALSDTDDAMAEGVASIVRPKRIKVDANDIGHTLKVKRESVRSSSSGAADELAAAIGSSSEDATSAGVESVKSDEDWLTGVSQTADSVAPGPGAHGLNAAAEGLAAPSRAFVPVQAEVCAEQNLTSSTPRWGHDTFSLGGRADSTYEYFPKQYLLLGGVEEKYRKLHEKAMDAATKRVLFRPMLPGNKDILFAGKWEAWVEESGELNGTLVAETGHLDCFAGGMYALGAKIFDRPNDLKIAAKLTEGCVWAYSSTRTGIMPEGFAVLPCKDKTVCEWNETAYFDALDPWASSREETYQMQLTSAKQNAKPAVPQLESASSVNAEWLKSSQMDAEKARDRTLSKVDANNPQNIADEVDDVPEQKNPQKIADDAITSPLQRRQLGDEESTASKSRVKSLLKTDQTTTARISGKSASNTRDDDQDLPRSARKTTTDFDDDEDEDDNTPAHREDDNHKAGSPQRYAGSTPTTTEPESESIPDNDPDLLPIPAYTPSPPPTHEEYVKTRIEEERLPAGMVRVDHRGYLLRPEAIESVWYMYRITGDEHWRKVGWDMFRAVNDHTRGVHGNSAIDDVTKTTPEKNDSQESFWLAETLKYFYLLFSEESVISLDEWVLNTEAHPFRRPLPPTKA